MYTYLINYRQTRPSIDELTTISLLSRLGFLGRLHKPVLFSCPRCGAGLDIAAESPRILTCKYCDSDLYLPDALWHALHPVKRRAPFWVGFEE